MEMYDHIVIGAGVEGSATALHLAKRMKKTLLLEQFNLPHTRGSSHGQSRIIRYSYPEDFYAKMMPYSYDQWYELEKLTNTKLLQEVGLLTVSEPPSTVISQTANSLKMLNIPYEYLSPQQLKLKYPMLRLSDKHEGVFEASGGILKADKCVAALQKVFSQYGGEVRDGDKVCEVRPSGVDGPVTVITRSGREYRARSVVICAGAWANSMLTALGLTLPLQVKRINVCYWPCLLPDSGSHNPPRLPCAMINAGGEQHVYAIPCGEYADLMKVCYHSGVDISNPDERDMGASLSSYDVDNIRTFIRASMPGVDDQPAIIEHCMYTNTPDSHPILDRHPHFRNIIIGAGFSGHGFKLAPSVGKILSDLAIGTTPTFTIEPFSVHRFNTGVKMPSKY